MANFNNHRLALRDPAQPYALKGVSPRLRVFKGNKPPGPWLVRDSDGQPTTMTLGTEDEYTGSLVIVETGNTRTSGYREMYVHVRNPYPQNDPVFVGYPQVSEIDDYELASTEWRPWKKVDLAWPKIDPATGLPFDQYLSWYSPLAE